MDCMMPSKPQVEVNPLTKYVDMLEGSLLMAVTAFKTIQKSKNLSAAKKVACVAEEGIQRYAKNFAKD